ncbi:DUF2586 family protein [Flavobacterium sp. GA093]|uniref:DUF2586 family protein n=1 Tax=Flavobacterium hydrocarbonoxydans TaxID=2683249 RepID=A0A6I4NEE9_9FLAO|nr:DUF2586 family protein [Flavobacterium hydrocarbonoxydans]MWB92986.1 DUF2586 family protein [Flavobacterium hydrocarbonoxydans]
MLPGVEIEFQNGQLGTITDRPDGVFGVLASAIAVSTTFLLEKAYEVKSMLDVAALGILPSVGNYRLYKFCEEFYNETGEGASLWIMGFDNTDKVSDFFTPDVVTQKTPAEKLLDAANGAISGLFVSFDPDNTYVPVITTAIDADVIAAMPKAQLLADNYTDKEYAPFFVYLEGYAFSGVKSDLVDLTTLEYNRVGVLLGDTITKSGNPASKGAAIGVLAGRLASKAVHINPGRVRDGAIKPTTAFILDIPVELYDIASLHDKGFVSFRNHKRKTGYYLTDGPLACEVDDDYHYITHRRVIDKSYRLAYDALVEFTLDDLDVNPNGTIQALSASVIEQAVVAKIYSEMTLEGELSYNPSDSSDRGVICKVDLTHNVASTGRIKIKQLQVRSKAYARYINVPLGFVPITSNN